MNLGDAGKKLIQSYEQCRLEAYMPTPNDVPTIGWGHTRGVAMGDICTQEQADAWFDADIQWVEDCVNRAVTTQLTQQEFDALCSLCFNIGCHVFSGSTLIKDVNSGNFDEASKQFAAWNKQHGTVLAGLTKRRAAEQELFDSTA